MPRLKAQNLAISTLAEELPFNASSCVVADASVLPDVPFRAVIGSGDNFEIVEVTAKNGNTLTLLRGLEGTTAQTWAAGTRLVNRLTAGCWDEVCRLIQLTSAELLTISSDAITITQSFHIVDTEGGASTDDLATINGGTEGDLLFLRSASSQRTVVLKHGVGNIRIPSGQDFSLDSTDKAVLLLYDGTNWLLVGAAGERVHWDDIEGKPSTFPPDPHAPSHAKDGSDPLPTDIPAAITEGASAAEGTATSFARADHRHATPSEWTPKVHGNEKHSPEFLARDGSNTMAGPLMGATNRPFPVFSNFAFWAWANEEPRFSLPYFISEIAFNTLRGGSVSFNPSPSWGTIESLFNGRADPVTWNYPQGNIIVEVTLWRQFSGAFIIGIIMPTFCRAKNIKAEVYYPSTGQWETAYDLVNHPYGQVDYFFWTNTEFSKLRFTFSNFAYTSYFQISQIYLVWHLGEFIGSYALLKDGGKMYGNLDLNGYDILGLRAINPTSGNLGLGTTSPANDAILDLNPGDSRGLRLRPRSTSGAPTSGTWSKGTMIVDADGVLWICTADGTPGTWQKVGAQ